MIYIVPLYSYTLIYTAAMHIQYDINVIATDDCDQIMLDFNIHLTTDNAFLHF